MTGVEPERPAVLAPAPAAGQAPAEAPATFSVVIPAYQATTTIAAAIASVLDQTRAPLELIVVDDGSTDDLAGAVRPFADRIELIRKSNGGAASARNAGMEAARGDFMAVLDADDRFHPRRLEALAGLARERPDLDLVTTDARFVIDGEGVGSFLAENPFAVEGQREAILASCFVGGWPAARVGQLREVGGFDERLWIGHDWDCWLRMILSGSAAGLVDLPYYDYVLHPGGLTSSRARALWDRVRLLEKALQNPDLRPAERPLAERELGRRRADAVREEALGGNASRRDLLRMATVQGAGRARALALLAAASPRLARRASERRPSPEEHLAGGRE